MVKPAPPVWPEEVQAFIRDNLPGHGSKVMTGLVNDQFGTCYTHGQMKRYYLKNGLNSGADGRYKKGHIEPYHPPKTDDARARIESGQYKKGNRPHNAMPIGAVVVKPDGYLWKKTGPGSRDWKQLHRLIWEEVNGPIPKNYRLIFLNGCRGDVALENLRLVSCAQLIELTRSGLRSRDADTTAAAASLAELNVTIRKKIKRCKKNETDSRHTPGRCNCE